MLDKIINDYKIKSLDRLTEMLLRIKIEDLLTESCFYYSCGADISPIIALKDEIHSFIYSDAHTIWGRRNYDEKIYKLKTELRKNNFKEIQTFKIDLDWLVIKNKTFIGGTISDYQLKPEDFLGEFSLWENESKLYFLTYISWDNTATWNNLYVKFKITPTAICNYLYETGIPYNDDDGLFKGCGKPKYIIGHNRSADYYCKQQIDYYGHWSDSKTIDLFKLKK
jgi:hypothetical protein